MVRCALDLPASLALRAALVCSLVFSGGYLHAALGRGVPFTGAVFTTSAGSTGNSFSTPASFTVANLAATGVAGGVQLDWDGLTWASGYNVYRGLSDTSISGTALNASPLPAGTVSYTDTTAAPGTTYYYTVRALNSRGIVAPAPAAVSGAVSTDVVAPEVSSLSPAHGTVDVGIGSQISVVFSEPMRRADTEAAITLQPCTDNTSACTTPGTAVTLDTAQWYNNDTIVERAPTASLATGQYHRLRVDTTAKDVAGNTLAAAVTNIFRTGAGTDTIAPQVVPPLYPADGQVGVSLNVSIVIPFSEAMQKAGTQSAVRVLCASGQTGCVEPSTSGYTFSWNDAGSVLTVTPGGLTAEKHYVITIYGAAKDLAGNRLAGVAGDLDVAFSSSLFTTGSSFDTDPPLVVPPTTPEHGATGIPTNANIVIRFSEAMRQSTTQSAISVVCTVASGCADPSPLSFSWNSSGNTVTIQQPGMTADKSYTVTVGPEASDLAGNQLGGSGTSFAFTTASGADNTAPASPTVTSPSAAAWTAASTYTISGTTPENTLLLKVWRDADGNGALDTSVDPLVTEIQLYGTLTTFSIDAPLAPGVRNDFLVTASDLAGNLSSAAVVPPIYQGDRATTTGAVGAVPGNVSMVVTAPYSGDLAVSGNTTNSATVEWDTTGAFTATSCADGAAGKCAMSRGTDAFTYTIAGLSSTTTYYVRVTYVDPDGVNGTAVQTITATTLDGSQTGLITSSSASPSRIASRAPQSTTIQFTIDGAVQKVQLEIKDGTNTTVRNFGCQTPSGTTISYSWNGTRDNGNAVPDGVYTAVMTAANAAVCTSNAEQLVGSTIVVSNVASIGMVPAPASITLGSNESVVVVATVRNARNELVGDGVPVSWLRTGSNTDSGSSMATTTSQTGVSNATAACTVASGSGQACNRLTVTTAVTQTITVEATIASQAATDTGNPPALITILGATTVNDPPQAPAGLELSLGSIRMAWQRAGDPRVAGYRVYIGTQSRSYTTTIDVGPATAYRYEPVTPGTRYYVTVRSYDKNGQLSPLGDEASIDIPAATPTATATRTPTATVTSTATRTVTSTATATTSTTPTATPTASVATTASVTPAGSVTVTSTASSAGTATPTPSPTATWTPAPTATTTPAGTVTPTTASTATPASAGSSPVTTATGTAGPGSAPLLSPTATATPPGSSTSTSAPSASPEASPNAGSPTPAPSASPQAAAPTSTATATAGEAQPPAATATPTSPPDLSPTGTLTATPAGGAPSPTATPPTPAIPTPSAVTPPSPTPAPTTVASPEATSSPPPSPTAPS